MSPEQIWQALRALGLLAMALVIGWRLFPGLRAHRTRLLGFALALYLSVGTALLVWLWAGW